MASWLTGLASVQEQGLAYTICQSLHLPWHPVTRDELDHLLLLALTKRCDSRLHSVERCGTYLRVYVVVRFGRTLSLEQLVERVTYDKHLRPVAGSRLCPWKVCKKLGFDWTDSMWSGMSALATLCIGAREMAKRIQTELGLCVVQGETYWPQLTS